MAATRGKMSREKILEGAAEILNGGKYSALTVDALARSLRMSKSTLYKYFTSKEQVVVSIVRDACDETDAEIERTLAGGSPSEQLVELAAIVGRHGDRLPRALITEPERVPLACAQRLSATRELFAETAHALVAQGVERKTFDHPAPRVVAVAFVASCEAVLADRARTGEAGYSSALTLLPQLFVSALEKGA